MIKSATIAAIWDNGVRLSSACKVNTETLEVFDIRETLYDDTLDVFFGYWLMLDGKEYPVCLAAELKSREPHLANGQSCYWLK